MAAKDTVVAEIVANTRGAVSDVKQFAATIATAMAAVEGIKKVLEQTFENAQLAARLNQQELAFRNLASQAGESADDILESMSQMSGRTVTEMQLMQSASRAAILGIPFDSLTDLMEIARASARGTGEDVKFMFESITTGIARGSPLILDNLGITLDLKQANQDYALALGKTAESLTDTERKQALLNAVLASGKEIVDAVGGSMDELTAVEQWDALQTAVTEFRTEMGQGLQQTFKDLSAAATDFFVQMRVGMEQRRLFSEISDMMDAAFGANTRTGRDEEAIARIMGFSPDTLAAFVGAIEKELETAETVLAQRESQPQMFNERAIKQAGDRVDEINTLLARTRDIYEEVRTAADGAFTGGDGEGGDSVKTILNDRAMALEYINELFGQTAEGQAAVRAETVANLETLRDFFVGIGGQEEVIEKISAALEDLSEKTDDAATSTRTFANEWLPLQEFIESSVDDVFTLGAAWADAAREMRTADDVLADLGETLRSDVLDAALQLPAALGQAAGAGEKLGDVLTREFASMIKSVGLSLMKAGAEMLALSGGTNPMGWALLAGGAGMAGFGGFLAGRLGASEASTASASTDSDYSVSSFPASGGTTLPDGARVISVTVQGDIYTEDRLESKILSLVPPS